MANDTLRRPDRRAHCHHRHGLPLPGRRGHAGVFWRIIEERRRRHQRSARRSLGCRGVLRSPIPDAPGKMYHPLGRLPRPGRPIRPLVSSASLRARPPAWIRSSACCSKSHGKPSSTPACRRTRLAGSRTGVFIGIHSQSSDYCWLQISDRTGIDTYTSTGTAHSIIPNRLSYLLRSAGAESGGGHRLLVVARRRPPRRAKACAAANATSALAGGVNLMLSPELTIAFSKLRHDGARRPLQSLRRRGRRLRARRGLRRRRAEAPRRRAGRRRPRSRASSRGIGGQSGRPHATASPRRTAWRSRRSSAQALDERRASHPQRDRLRRGARHRHAAGRSHRGGGAGRRARRAVATIAVARSAR